MSARKRAARQAAEAAEAAALRLLPCTECGLSPAGQIAGDYNCMGGVRPYSTPLCHSCAATAYQSWRAQRGMQASEVSGNQHSTRYGVVPGDTRWREDIRDSVWRQD